MLVKQGKASVHRACRLLGLSRATYRYRPRPKDDTALRDGLAFLAKQYPRYGYLLLHGLLKAEGLVVNRKRTYRLYTESGLTLPRRKRGKLTRPVRKLEVPHGTNQRWSIDFVSD
jgi:putative transposase